MKIRYENNLEDLVAFNRYHFDHSPSVWRTRILLFLVIPVCILLYVVVSALLMDGLLEVIAGWVVIAVLLAFVGPWGFRSLNDRQVRKLYGEGTNKGAFGERELELTEDDLIERTLYGEQRTRLRAIEKVVMDGGYAFIYLIAVMAHVIPRDAVLDGDYEAFVERVKRGAAEIRSEESVTANRPRDERFFER